MNRKNYSVIDFIQDCIKEFPEIEEMCGTTFTFFIIGLSYIYYSIYFRKLIKEIKRNEIKH